MKKLFSLLVCLLLCFSFSFCVHAEDDFGFEMENGESYDDEDEEFWDDEELEDEEFWDDEELEDEEFWDDEELEDEDYDVTYEDELEKDASVENSQTSDIPIILIASIAIISLIIVLSKKNTFVNKGY